MVTTDLHRKKNLSRFENAAFYNEKISDCRVAKVGDV